MNLEQLRKALKAAQEDWVQAAKVAREEGTQEARDARSAAEKKVEDLKAELAAAEEIAAEDAKAEERARESEAKLKAGTGRTTSPDGASHAPKIGKVKAGYEEDPNCGFKDPAEFVTAIRQITVERGQDERLSYLSQKRFATAGSDEHSTFSNPYGGFFVPESFAFDPLKTGMDMDPISNRVTRIPMATRRVTFNARVDKNHTSSVSGGLQVYRRAEADTVASSRTEHEQVKLEATELFGVTYATEELLEESAISFVAMLEAGFRDEFVSKMIDEKIDGTGAGMPMGVLNSPCTISVAKESMQAADTINGTNILKMRERAWRYGSSVWLANHDTYRQLVAAHTTLTNDDYPLFIHGNGTDVPDTLLGRPIYFTEHVPTVGDQGDLILGDWSQYLYGVFKPLRNASSMHVRFLENEQTFKFWMADAGAPWWRTALTPKNGANTLSPFVVLDARA